MLAPSPVVGTERDFAPEDPVEQAIGPDPFHPQPFRSWTWDEVPSAFPASYFDVRNLGQVQRHAVLTIGGGSGNVLDDVASRLSHAPVYDRWFDFRGTARNGIVFGADVAAAAILFQQPHERAQPIVWNYLRDGQLQSASLSVSPHNGSLTFDGPGTALPGGLLKVGGISGTETPARNLRAIDVPVAAGTREFTVSLPVEESDAKYGVFVETSWLTLHVVSSRTEKTFTVKFSEPAPSDAHISWLMAR
jgi:hypothetical protein